MARPKLATSTPNSLQDDSELRKKYALTRPEEVELRLIELNQWASKIEADTQEPALRDAAQTIRIIGEVLLEQVFS